MLNRFKNYWNTYRQRGSAKMDHGLWLYWAVFGKYP